MIGMSIGEFMSKIYYGDEIEFQIDDITYLVQGGQHQQKFYLTVDYWRTTDGTESPHNYLFSDECGSPEERLKRFEDAHIFNGQTIYEVDYKVKVLFG